MTHQVRFLLPNRWMRALLLAKLMQFLILPVWWSRYCFGDYTKCRFKKLILSVPDLRFLTLVSVCNCWSAYRLQSRLWIQALLLIAHVQLQLKCVRPTLSDNQLFYDSPIHSSKDFWEIFSSLVDRFCLWMNYKYFDVIILSRIKIWNWEYQLSLWKTH